MHKTTITVGGPPGSGTSTLCKLLEKELGFRYVYVGLLFRELAKERGMSLTDFGEYARAHPEIDRELDRRSMIEAKSGNIILEGRLSGAMTAKNSITAFRVWVDADIQERIRRIIKREGGTPGNTEKTIILRETGERRRYLETYGIDLMDMSYYDMVIDSTHLSPHTVARKVIASFKRWKLIR